MYIPAKYEVKDTDNFIQLIKENPLGTLVTGGVSGDDLIANHIPFIVQKDEETDKMCLIAHLAASNSQVKVLENGKDTCLIVFKGPDSYISPSWYPSKKETHKFVPTWDFSAVHVYGKPTILRDEEFKYMMLDHLTNGQEGKRVGFEDDQWKLQDAPESYLKLMMKNIVGLKIEITKMDGKWKFEQKTKEQDIKGTVEGLEKEKGEIGKMVANCVRECNKDIFI